MNAKPASDYVWFRLILCAFIMLISAVVPFRSPIWSNAARIIGAGTSIQFFFFMWCAFGGSSLVTRFEHHPTVVTISVSVTMAMMYHSLNDTLFLRGVVHCIGPIGMLKDCRSYVMAIAVMAFMVSVTCRKYFSEDFTRVQFDELERDQEWLILNVISYAIAIILVSKNANLHKSERSREGAIALLQTLMSSLCDGYMLLDKNGVILGEDQRAASIFPLRQGRMFTTFSEFVCSRSPAVNRLRPGLQKMLVWTKEAADVSRKEVEAYTCTSTLDLASMKEILGPKHICTDRMPPGHLHGGNILLRALRIVACADEPGTYRADAATSNGRCFQEEGAGSFYDDGESSGGRTEVTDVAFDDSVSQIRGARSDSAFTNFPPR